MPPPDKSGQNSPLAPSVEKAYYRKCIELKRRLNEVEAANDEAKIKRVRLDRAIMKMRLERAFLLDELRKRMDFNPDGSEASGDEGMATPPADRPHRDKRRRQQPIQPAAPPQPVLSHGHPPPTYPPPAAAQRVPSQLEVPLVPGPAGAPVPANAVDADGRYIYVPQQELASLQQQQHQGPTSIAPYPHAHGSPYGAPVGVPGASDRRVNGMNLDGAGDDDGEREAPINREAGASGEALSAGPTIAENANGERRIVADTPAESASAQVEQRDTLGDGGFTAVNQ